MADDAQKKNASESFYCPQNKICGIRAILLAAITDLTRSSATAEIARISVHYYAFQGYSMSLILIPIESPYTTSYYWIIRTYIVYRTLAIFVAQYCSNNYRFWQGVILVNALVLDNLRKYRHKSYCYSFRYIFVADSLCLFSSTLT